MMRCFPEAFVGAHASRPTNLAEVGNDLVRMHIQTAEGSHSYAILRVAMQSVAT